MRAVAVVLLLVAVGACDALPSASGGAGDTPVVGQFDL